MPLRLSETRGGVPPASWPTLTGRRRTRIIHEGESRTRFVGSIDVDLFLRRRRHSLRPPIRGCSPGIRAFGHALSKCDGRSRLCWGTDISGASTRGRDNRVEEEFIGSDNLLLYANGVPLVRMVST